VSLIEIKANAARKRKSFGTKGVRGVDYLRSAPMKTEKFDGQDVKIAKFDDDQGWRTLWLAIAGVMAIMLTWNVLMLTFKGISY
jgi:hypothetical protein